MTLNAKIWVDCHRATSLFDLDFRWDFRWA